MGLLSLSGGIMEPRQSIDANNGNEIFKFNPEVEVTKDYRERIFVYGKNNHHICTTDKRGYPQPRNASKFNLLVDTSDGFIPLWAADVILRWRFDALSLSRFADPDAAKAGIRLLLGEALLKWGDAAPVRFQENDDTWDFEIVVQAKPNCDAGGCVLASAFFPDGGRHELTIFPTFFSQDKSEQVETLIHELGHVFGLRHFFALIKETAWRAEIFGTHDESNPFSIMNYGQYSELTDTDRSDLKKLYALVWSGKLNQINGTQIRLMQPYHTAKDNLANKLPLDIGLKQLFTR